MTWTLVWVVAICVLGYLAVRAWVHVAQMEVPPDPWDDELGELTDEEAEVPVCHHCFTPIPQTKWFCPECGASVGTYNNLIPFVRIFAGGEVWRSFARRWKTRQRGKQRSNKQLQDDG